MSKRKLCEIAKEIRMDWKKPNWEARPFLDAMASLNDINDQYGWHSGISIVQNFLFYARYWRGEKARRIKAELKEMLNDSK